MVLPPSLVGALNTTEIDAFAGVTVGWAGALGTIAGIVAPSEADDSALLPSALVAWTVQVYVLPLLSAGTAMGELAPVLEPLAPPLLDVQLAV